MAKGGKRTGSGRKRKPAELRVLEGSFRKDRHGGVPAVSGGFPAAPDCLSEAERALWAAFPRPAWIGNTDAIAVHAAVSLYANVRQLQRARLEYSGDGLPLGLIAEEAKQWGRLMSVLGTLGLTPADRTKMQAPRADDNTDDKWAGIL